MTINARKVLFTILPAVLFSICWQLLVEDNQKFLFLFASPYKIIEVAILELETLSFWYNVYITTLEATLGLFVGFALGTILGISLWLNKYMAEIAKPYIIIFGSIPIFAIAPILIIWFGTGLLSKVIMAAFSVLFICLAQAYEGAKFCSKEYTSFAESINTSRLQIIFYIVIPGALRWVVAGLKMSIGLSLVGAFIGEFVSSQAGLGHYILKAGSLYDMPRVLFGVIIISIVALTMTTLVRVLERCKPNFFTI